MKKSKFYNAKTKRLVQSVMDNMIPSENIMPAASKAIKINKFLITILKDQKVKNILKKKEINFYDLQKSIEKQLLQEYFKSKMVIDRLKKKQINFYYLQDLLNKTDKIFKN